MTFLPQDTTNDKTWLWGSRSQIFDNTPISGHHICVRKESDRQESTGNDRLGCARVLKLGLCFRTHVLIFGNDVRVQRTLEPSEYLLGQTDNSSQL